MRNPPDTAPDSLSYSWLPKQGRARRYGKLGGRPRRTLRERLELCAYGDSDTPRTMMLRSNEAEWILAAIKGRRLGDEAQSVIGVTNPKSQPAK